jgi:hypothetical protein
MTVSGTAGQNGRLFNLGVYDAPRRAPLAAITQSIAVQINDAQVKLNTSWVADVLLRTATSYDEIDKDLSTFPAMPDYFANYQDAYNPALNAQATPVPGPNVTGGNGKNIFSGAGGMSEGYEPRGAWRIDSIVDPTVAPGAASTATVTFTTTEPLFVSPFGASARSDDSLALLGVQTMDVTLTFANLEKIWSHVLNDQTVFAPGGPVAEYPSTLTFQSLTIPSARLLQRFLTLSQVEKIPATITYRYNVVNVYPTSGTALAGGAQTTTTTSSQTLAYIPKRLMIWVAPQPGLTKMTTSDSYARIDKINITWDNQNGVLAGAAPSQLYEISRSNGLSMSYNAWQSFTGSILIADFAKDLGLENDAEAVSVPTNKQIQVDVTYTNLATSATPVQFQVFLATISDGTIDIGQNSAIQRVSVLTPEDVLKAKSEGHEMPAYQPAQDFYGGRARHDGFLGLLKKGAHALKDIAKKEHLVSRGLVEFGAPKIVSDIAAMQGYGSGRASKAALQARRM